jgi:SAM-dependent methyltransferase
MNDAKIQQSYYSRTASNYDARHLHNGEPEHDVALATFLGLSRYYQFASFLDVGAGTGRTLIKILETFPERHVCGVEPAKALREVAYAKGISTEVLKSGDAHNLDFQNDSFDVVTAFGVLHHVRHPRRCIREMLRVSRRAIFISDLNNFGCGGVWQRGVAQALNALGLWKVFQFCKTGGKMFKISEGDGLFFSYSLFNDLAFIREHCSEVILLNTRGRGGNPYRDCSHVALLGLKDPGRKRSAG